MRPCLFLSLAAFSACAQEVPVPVGEYGRAVSPRAARAAFRSRDGETVQVRERGVAVDEFSAADAGGMLLKDRWYWGALSPRGLHQRPGLADAFSLWVDSNGRIAPFDSQDGRTVLADGLFRGSPIVGGTTGVVAPHVPPTANTAILRLYCRDGEAAVNFTPDGGGAGSASSVQAGEFVDCHPGQTARFEVGTADSGRVTWSATAPWSGALTAIGYTED